MNGAQTLVQTLIANGVDVCFANPGTSEMQFVAALDTDDRMRSVLCLFEGVVTGAADGYGRIAGKPACTLLHLGPGYANGGANLHNARRAGTPIVNIIGDHATYHRVLDAPLNSDIAAWTKANSVWCKSIDHVDHVGEIASEAIASAQAPRPGSADLLLPADTAWTEGGSIGPIAAPKPLAAPTEDDIASAAKALRDARKPIVLISRSGAYGDGLVAAGRLSALGYRVMTDTFVPRQSRGAGRFNPERMPYFAELAMADLEGVDLLLFAGTQEPAAFFAYPDKPSLLVPEGCQTQSLCGPNYNVAFALTELANALDAPPEPVTQVFECPELPTGKLNAYTVGASIARHMPDYSIVSDDSVTSSRPVFSQTKSARAHDWLMLTGGAIGQGMPVAIGAAVAAPDRKVISLNGDGAAMYTVQSLWTIAREKLDIVVIIFANGAYKILEAEFVRTGSGIPGKSSQPLLSLAEPSIDWCSIARGMGLLASRCETAEQFDDQIEAACARRGPQLIEVAIS